MTPDERLDLAGLPPLSRLRALGVDPGTARIGVAVGAAGVATPVATIGRTRDRQSDLRRLVKLVADYEVDVVVVGLPVSLDGRLAGAAKRTLSEVKLLRRLLSVPVTTYDERFSTVTAEQSLHQLDLTGPGRRSVVDQVAAAVILQGWLDARLNQARPHDDQGEAP